MASTEELMAQYGVVWFGFDEASGNVYDKLGSNYVGTVTGATRVEGWNGEGNAMSFNGNSFIKFNSNPMNNNEFTIRLKFLLKSFPANGAYSVIIQNENLGYNAGSGKGYFIQIGSNKSLSFEWITSRKPYTISNSITTSIETDKWYDAIFYQKIDNGKQVLGMCINGEFIRENKSSINFSLGSTNLMIGANDMANFRYYFNGQIDDLQIYSKALTPSDFTQNHIAIKTQDNKNLVLPNRSGRVKEIPSSDEADLIKQGYAWREIDNAVDGGMDLTQETTEYEIVSKSKMNLGSGKIFTIPLDDFKTVKIENDINEDKHLVSHGGQYKYHNGTSWQPTTPTQENFIQYGHNDLSHITEEQWQELQGSKSIAVWSDFEDKEYVSVVLEKEPFTAKQLIGNNAQLIVHTTSQVGQNIISTEVEPYSFYDIFEDEAEVFCYTDNINITEADLILEANWSPLDELEGDIEVLTYFETLVEPPPILTIETLVSPQLVVPVSDISIQSIENIKKISLKNNTSGRGILKTIVSFDEGDTYYTHDGSRFVEIPLDLDNALENGITPQQLESIPEADWNALRSVYDTFRMAYALSVKDETDRAEADVLEFLVDMKGTWKAAVHGRDYDYEYPDNQTVLVTLYSNGDYKMNV